MREVKIAAYAVVFDKQGKILIRGARSRIKMTIPGGILKDIDHVGNRRIKDYLLKVVPEQTRMSADEIEKKIQDSPPCYPADDDKENIYYFAPIIRTDFVPDIGSDVDFVSFDEFDRLRLPHAVKIMGYRAFVSRDCPDKECLGRAVEALKIEQRKHS